MINQETLINFRDEDQLARRSPLLIAHRGGVISTESPENSLAAIKKAAEAGYDMVELDVVFASDDEPVLFHGREPWGTLAGTSGGDTRIETLSSQDLTHVVYNNSDQRIALLDEALALCKAKQLGVMFDFKAGSGAELSREGVRRTASLIEQHGLALSSMVITPTPLIRELLPEGVLFPVKKSELYGLQPQGGVSAIPGIWFDLPENMPTDLIHRAQASRILVIPAINTFRYRDDPDQGQANADIRRLVAAGVDGFQIDSVYRDAFPVRLH